MKRRYITPFCLGFIMLFVYGCAKVTTPASTANKTTNKQSDHIIAIPFAPFNEWSERNFAGTSQVHISKHQDSGLDVLNINSDKSASLFYKKVSIDLNQTPYINWQWAVENTYANNTQERLKQGDDFPARIYIAIKPELGQIKPRALTYVWASHERKFNHWKNPFNNTVEVLALQSGPTSTGNWLTEKRNLQEDLSNLFGQEIESIEGIGIMSDSDNSGAQSKAQFRNLYFSNH